jgi:hypothetical protein
LQRYGSFFPGTARFDPSALPQDFGSEKRITFRPLETNL